MGRFFGLTALFRSAASVEESKMDPFGSLVCSHDSIAGGWRCCPLLNRQQINRFGLRDAKSIQASVVVAMASVHVRCSLVGRE